MAIKICTALTNENYEYRLSGDNNDYCICTLNDRKCIGIDVEDPNNQSSQFFSKGKNVINEKNMQNCPAYGCTKEVITLILEGKTKNKLENIK